MQESNVKSAEKLLKKLRRKAEICRFAHSEEWEKFKRNRNLKEFTVVLFSVISATFVGFYLRGMVNGDLALLIIFILSLAITLLQSLDHTVFQWAHNLARHESAVEIWGGWIREADFLEKRIQQYSNEVNERMQSLQEKYSSCMSSTKPIPNSKFLKYKEKFYQYKAQSKKLDDIISDN